MSDLTLVYYTANFINPDFADNLRRQLAEAAGDNPIVIVSQKPEDANYWKEIGFSDVTLNCVGNIGRSHLNIYRQALWGAKLANTKYIALVEDDVLYSPDHFKYRPKPGFFAYNLCVWGLYTWVKPPLFSYKGRRNLHALICERELFIKAMEERFTKYPTDETVNISIWAEPGKYESQLGVTVQQSEEFCPAIPNIMFSHETAFGFLNLGYRKRIGFLRATALPYWGSAEDIVKLYV